MNLLVIRTSILGDHSTSGKLLDHWISTHKPASVVERNLVSDPIPHLDGHHFEAINAAEPTDVQRPAKALSDKLIAEINAADHIVIGLPMYNFGVPSQLKAWMDNLARAGVTFEYTANGPQGLLADKPVTIIATRGGAYAGSQADSQTPFVKQFLNFIGLHDLRFIFAEKLAMAAGRDKTITNAETAINNDLLATA